NHPGRRDRASRAGRSADVLRADAAARAVLLLCVRPTVVGWERLAGAAPLGTEDAPAEVAAAQAEIACLRAALRERHGLVPCYLRAGHGGRCGEAGKRQVHAGSEDLGQDQEPAVQPSGRTRGFFPAHEGGTINPGTLWKVPTDRHLEAKWRERLENARA